MDWSMVHVSKLVQAIQKDTPESASKSFFGGSATDMRRIVFNLDEGFFFLLKN